MATTEKETTSLLTRTLPSTSFSAWMARYYVRVALGEHDLNEYAGDAATVTSELVTNAIIHTGAEKIGLEMAYVRDRAALVITVLDSSPEPPVRLDPADVAEYGRGLNIVAALSARWGWRPQSPGKAVYAILTREA